MLPGVGSSATGAAEPPHAMAVIASTVVSTPRPRRGAHEAALHTEVVGRCGPLVPTNLKAVAVGVQPVDVPRAAVTAGGPAPPSSAVSRSARARATRERIVPTGQRQIRAASAQLAPMIWVSTNADRRSGSSVASRSATATCSAWSLGASCAVTAAAASRTRRRRVRVRSASAQTRRAMDSSNVRAVASPRNTGSARPARTNVSCVRSSAAPGSTRCAQRRHTSGWLRRIHAARQTSSPVRARSSRRDISSTAAEG